MATRTPIVGGNWKMNTTRASAVSLAETVATSCREHTATCDVVIFPPFPYLSAVGEALGDSGVQLGAQDVYHESDGAFTGEVSTAMLRDIGVNAVILGHSERRHVIGEDDALIHRKLLATLEADLLVIFCVGETLEQREAGQTETIVLGQLESGLTDVPASRLVQMVIAYEPVWAIGTGRTASPEDAQAVHACIRTAVASRYDDVTADSLRIQYGGSVKADNASALFAQPDIDGGLIGGASLDGGAFASIVREASRISHGASA